MRHGKGFQALLAGLMLFASLAITPAAHATPMAAMAEPRIMIQLDGVMLPAPVDPIQYNARTMVPFRTIGAALGLSIEWDEATQTVIATGPGKEVRLQVGNKTATVEKKSVALDAEPILVQDRVLIPVRFLSEQFGAKVGWDEATNTVLITSQPRQMDTMVFYGLGSYDKRNYLPKFKDTALTWSILDANGSFNVNQSEYHWPTEGADDFLKEVKSEKVGTTLMVFSENKSGEITKLMGNPDLQQKFATDLANKLTEQGLDGAMLDFETLGDPVKDDVATVRAHYASLVKIVADVLHKQNKKLSVVMAPLNGWYKGYDYQAVAQSADQLFIMAYSYVNDKLPQPNDKVQEAIQMAQEVVPSDKLMLGINAYSETPQTVKEKIGLAKRYNLRGVGFWILVVFDPDFMNAIDDSLILHDETKDDIQGG
ncbi:copper amine oxidase [Tumebacillus sp. ITR2]|uniref:Copper amine oxidase n=1 Tax=Tumebacillus amylolyticus TaxID=2801339 RepID=A0ABS1JFW8_9BACL|nr:stalk domain-containing protein [Tumebacillus amylolyticus]MBL0389185.1 copper amine oxidase [Tumebacillus amylolyticus]